MPRRARHRAVGELLSRLDVDVLNDLKCYFSSRSIALLLDELRESAYADFLCSDPHPYRSRRAPVFNGDADGLFRLPIMKRQTRYGPISLRAQQTTEGWLGDSVGRGWRKTCEPLAGDRHRFDVIWKIYPWTGSCARLKSRSCDKPFRESGLASEPARVRGVI